MCRYWRESIISAPESWTLIWPSLRLGLAALCLERSKAALLELDLDVYFVAQDLRIRDLIGPYIQNTGLLGFVKLTTTEDFTQTLPNFPQSMPSLRSLEIIHSDDDELSHWDPSIDPFGPFSNTLRSLSLYDILLYPSSFLKLRTLTKLTLYYYKIHTPLDALLDILEGNPLLKSVDLTIDFEELPVHISQPRIVTMDRLQSLPITCWNAAVGRTLISNIPLRRGADLHIAIMGLGLNEILSGIPTTHLQNLPSPTVTYFHEIPTLPSVYSTGWAEWILFIS